MKLIEEYQSKVLNNDYSEGSGATAVISSNIEMKMNEYGEYKEFIQDIDKVTEEEARKITEVSPMFSSYNEDTIAKKIFSQTKNIKYREKIGYYTNLYAGHVAEADYRSLASSGGMGTWILKELFEKKMIDGVIHVKATNGGAQAPLFKYDISYNIEEIREGAKTKYYPVEFSEVLKKVKNQPGKYAIVGIPSFIMAIRLLAQQDEVIADRIKYTIGLVCGHQKSSKFADYMGWQVGIKPGSLIAIDFRKKLNYGAANKYAVEMTGLVDGEVKTITKSTNELLGQNWGQGFFKSKASDFTDDVMNETADITIGDAWLPEYVKDNLGNNIIIVRDNGIQALINEGIETKKLRLDILDEDTIIKSQSSHYKHTLDELPYRLYKKDKNNIWHPKKRITASNDLSILRKKVQDLREIMSTDSHVLFKNAIENDNIELFTSKMKEYDSKYTRLYQLISLREKGLKSILKKITRK